MSTWNQLSNIIDGIPDNNNKMVLYGACDYNDFRTRLRTYEKMQERSSVSNKGSLKKEAMDQSTREKVKLAKDGTRKTSKIAERCYNCGESGHTSSTCKFKERGKKCFKCNDFGHESKNCPVKSNPKNTQATTNVLVKSINVNRMFKEILIDGKNFYALLDIGSHLSLMREDIFKSIDLSKLCESQVLLTGIAQGQVKTLGHFQTTIVVDSFAFPLTFHVVPTKALDVAVILGTDFINQAEIVIDQSDITVNKLEVTVFFTQIKLQPERNETIDTALMVDKRK